MLQTKTTGNGEEQGKILQFLKIKYIQKQTCSNHFHVSVVQMSSVAENQSFQQLQKNPNNHEQLADNFVSVCLDTQATGEQGERSGIPESDFILAWLWTII